MTAREDRWPPLDAQPFITVVMPVRNEERFLEGTIRQILDQDYPGSLLEILVCDGMSDDSTREIVRRLSEEDPRVRLIDNPGRRSSVGRNVGFKAARGEVSVVIDGHVRLPDDQLLASIARCFFVSKAACLGRPQPLLATHPGSMSEAISNARASRLGHSPSSFIHSDFEGFAPAASMGAAYRKEVFEEIGYVNEEFDAGEDLEFNTRVDEAGMTCFTSPSLTVLYYARDSLRGLFRQMHRYGYGRYKYLRQHPSEISVGQLIPPLFVLGLVALPFLPFLSWPLFLFAAGCVSFYALLVVIASFALARGTSFAHLLRYLAIFPTIHAGLGVGFLSSFLKRGKVRTYGPGAVHAK